MCKLEQNIQYVFHSKAKAMEEVVDRTHYAWGRVHEILRAPKHLSEMEIWVRCKDLWRKEPNDGDKDAYGVISPGVNPGFRNVKTCATFSF